MPYKGVCLIVPKPLRPWLWAVVWLVFFKFAFACFVEFEFKLQKKEFYNQVTFKSQSIRHVIGVGDSLLAYSLPVEQEFQHLIGSKTVWLQYWLPDATWVSFHKILDLNKLDLHSTTIIIQESLFLNRKQPGYERIINRVKANAVASINGTKPLLDGFNSFAHRNRKPGCISVHNTNVDFGEYNYQGQILTVDAISFLNELKGKSEHLIVIALPRAQLEKEHHQVLWRKQLIKELNALGIEFVVLGQSMPANYYCDGSHPNEIGRKVRTAQILQLINRTDASTP